MVLIEHAAPKLTLPSLPAATLISALGQLSFRIVTHASCDVSFLKITLKANEKEEVRVKAKASMQDRISVGFMVSF
jgi:hypothetical protein